MERGIDEAVLESLDRVAPTADGIETGVDLKGPASTWTYLINDDPFRNQIGQMLTGPGRATIAIAAAAGMMMPLLVAWGLVDRFMRKRR